MRHLDKNICLALLVAALLIGHSTRASASQIAVSSDSLTMRAVPGLSTELPITIWASNVDSLGDSLPLQSQTVRAYLTGDSAFQLTSDSVRIFYDGTITVRYSPASLSVTEATLTLVGSNNTVTVTLIGRPLSHTSPEIMTANYAPLQLNQSSCHGFSLRNPNPTAIHVTEVTVTSQFGGWSVENLASLPAAIPGDSTMDLGQLCAIVTRTTYEDSDLQGTLKIVYSYGTGIDSTSANLFAWVAAVNTSCITTGSGNFGTLNEGASKTQAITLANTTSTSVTLDSAQLSGDGEFTFDASQFPLTIPVGSSAAVNVTFTAPTSTTQGNYYASLNAKVHGLSPDSLPCDAIAVPLAATVYIPPPPSDDSITLDVPPGSGTLSISAHKTRSLHAIFIHNAGTRSIHLELLTASSSDTSQIDTTVRAYFGSFYDQSVSLSDTLAPNATVGPFIMTLFAQDTGTDTIGLTLMYEVQQAFRKGATPEGSNTADYTVVAHRLPPLSAGVSEPSAPQPVAFTLSPNPARGEVTIGLPSDASSNVEIYDVLGNLVFQGTERGAFIWNGLAGGSPVANGAYIVRVGNGNRVSSERLMLER